MKRSVKVNRRLYAEDVKTSHALLQSNPNPSQEQIRRALAGNLCMCTGYVQIVEAVKDAAKVMKNG
jgi:aerobic-type carbon monoxide dehydrogenase small subunit (CoxS/CutS family)